MSRAAFLRYNVTFMQIRLLSMIVTYMGLILGFENVPVIPRACVWKGLLTWWNKNGGYVALNTFLGTI